MLFFSEDIFIGVYIEAREYTQSSLLWVVNSDFVAT